MSVLLGVILLFAVFALVVAVVQAVAIVRLAPANAQLAAFMPLGWWKFGQLEARAGAAAAGPLNIYKRAVIVFLVFLVFGLVLSGWTVSRNPAAAPTAALVDMPSALSFASIPHSRVAPMPGAANILES